MMALLFVLLLVLCGCSGQREAYFSPAGESGELAEDAGAAVTGMDGWSADRTDGDVGNRMTAVEAGRTAGNDAAAAGAGNSAGNDVTAAEAGNSVGKDVTVAEAGRTAGNDVIAAGAGRTVGNDVTAAGAEESAGYVYVCGAVAHPGVYPLGDGMRVFEAAAVLSALELKGAAVKSGGNRYTAVS